MSFLENLDWRYATQSFDSSKKVSEENKNKILEAIQFAPTSYGLEPFHIHVIESKDLLNELGKVSGYNEEQITDSSFLIVFSARTDIMKNIEELFDLRAGGDIVKRQSMKEKEESYKKALTMDDEKTKSWATKQAYIALGFALAACAELKIDSCPMEGFDKSAYKKILNLPETLYPQALLAVGYRSNEDIPKKKIRFPKEKLFTEI